MAKAMAGTLCARVQIRWQMTHNRMKSVRHGVWVLRDGRPYLKAFRCPTYGCCG